MAEETPHPTPYQLALEKAETAIKEHYDSKRELAEGSDLQLDNGVLVVTVDLGNLRLQKIPDEIVDIIKDHVHRLAITHNRLTDLPLRLADCFQLRYLSLRSNSMRKIPEVILKLTNLETLDISRNKIESLPPDWSRLRTLRVLSLRTNRISKLPLCFGTMNALSRLLIDENPLANPPLDLFESWARQVSPQDADTKDVVLTNKVKEYLRLESAKEHAARTDTEGDTSEANVETPRPARRKASGRFPIKPSITGADISPLTGSPGPPLPLPPLPPKSTSRALANGQPGIALRPIIAPLITNNERYRSSSESQMATTLRAKRMGIPPPARLPQESTSGQKRISQLSHLRGFSHASALQGSVSTFSEPDSSGPSTPVELELPFSYSKTRLSSLAEDARLDPNRNPIIELAKGIVFSMSQLRTRMDDLSRAIRRSEPKRATWERICFAMFPFVRDLDEQLLLFEHRNEEYGKEVYEAFSQDVISKSGYCINMFENALVEIRRDLPVLVVNVDLRYVRMFMLQLYGSLTEIKNSCSRVGVAIQTSPRAAGGNSHFQSDYSTVRQRPSTSRRVRQDLNYQNRKQSLSKSSVPLRSMPSMPNGASFSSSKSNATNASSTTWRSDRSYRTTENGSKSSNSGTSTVNGTDDLDEERQFEEIIMKISVAVDLCERTLPASLFMFKTYRENAATTSAPAAELHAWQRVCQKCHNTLNHTEKIRVRLSNLRLREPGSRYQLQLWHAIRDFCDVFTALGIEARNVAQLNRSVSNDIKDLLGPIKDTVKDLAKTSMASPWAHLFVPSGSTPSHWSNTQSMYTPQNQPSHHNSVMPPSTNSSMSSGYVTPVPSTPLIAALGPAAQATMPSTPFDTGPGFLVGALNERLDKPSVYRR